MITYFKDELIGLVLLYDDVDGFPQVQLGLVGSIRTRVEGVVDDHWLLGIRVLVISNIQW